MASSSGLNLGSVPINDQVITPEATYEAVVADPMLFMNSLKRLHSLLGTKFTKVPIIGGKHLDLHKLFVEVTSRGGIDKILDERRWKEVTASFAFPAAATNATYFLRKNYISLLKDYEQVYFFRSNVQILSDFLQTPPARPGLMQGTIRPSQEVLGGSLTGSNVSVVIDGKFEDGYLVTVTMGSEQLKGVLYRLLPQNTVAHQTPQQSQSSGGNNVNPQGIAGGVTNRRRRREKSGESEPDDDQNGESDPELELEEPSLSPLGLNLNPNTTEIVVAPKEKTGDAGIETSPMEKAEEPNVVVTAEQN